MSSSLSGLLQALFDNDQLNQVDHTANRVRKWFRATSDRLRKTGICNAVFNRTNLPDEERAIRSHGICEALHQLTADVWANSPGAQGLPADIAAVVLRKELGQAITRAVEIAQELSETRDKMNSYRKIETQNQLGITKTGLSNEETQALVKNFTEQVNTNGRDEPKAVKLSETDSDPEDILRN